MPMSTDGLEEQNRHPVRRYKMQAWMESDKKFSVFELSLFAKDSLVFSWKHCYFSDQVLSCHFLVSPR